MSTLSIVHVFTKISRLIFQQLNPYVRFFTCVHPFPSLLNPAVLQREIRGTEGLLLSKYCHNSLPTASQEAAITP